MSEALIQQQIRIAASRKGWRVWRNNVGAGTLQNGSHVRWGLANESTAMNRQYKSSDLIGIRPVVITADHVGMTIGQFCAIEVKAANWHYTGTDREVAQARWIDMVRSLGGVAGFCCDADAIDSITGARAIDSTVNNSDTAASVTSDKP